mgnify:CR=1 FL=1
MLTIDQKEAVLRRAGRAVPDFPSGPAVHDAAHPQARDTRAAHRRAPRQALGQWSAIVTALYLEHLAAGTGRR